MRLPIVATTRWMFVAGVLLFAVALLASSCASFEAADLHDESSSHAALAACHNLGSAMGSRVSLPLIILLVLSLGFAALGSAVARIELENDFRPSFPADFSLTSITDHIQRAFQEGILHSRAYIAAFIPSG